MARKTRVSNSGVNNPNQAGKGGGGAKGKSAPKDQYQPPPPDQVRTYSA